MKTYKDILKTISELDEKHIENNMLETIEISLIAHFGNITTCELHFTNCVLFSGYNLGRLIPNVLKAIVECLELSKEDGLRISEIKNIPVRIVRDDKKAIGFGHYMKDKFLLVDDLIEMAKSNI